ncbi:hypothetical protein K435DRAFT_590194, partial [Dendrothele bispora CBS 962.96]
FPLRQYVENRDELVAEFIRLKGRGVCTSAECPSCPEKAPALYRCLECFSVNLVCSTCCIQMHKHNPLHSIEVCIITLLAVCTFFQRTSLRALGLRIQFGHEDGSICTSPEKGPVKFAVIASNGLHHVNIDFCGCARGASVPHWKQLLRQRWFPAT